MSLLITLIIGLPLLGAVGVLGTSLAPRFRSYARYIALATVAFSSVLVLMCRWTEPAMIIPSLWRPVSLFGATPTLQNNAIVQPLAFVLTLVVCSAILAAISRKENLPPRLTATILALLSTGLVALWAANALTMIIAWAIYDLLQAVGYIAAEGLTQKAIRSLIFSSLATLFLWSGAMLSHGGTESELWSLIAPSSVQLTLWAAAGLLRLWVYPFHLAAPDELGTSSSLAVFLFMGPIIGWGLWLRLASVNGGFIPRDPWVLPLAAATLAVGSFMAWARENPRSAFQWIGAGVTGAGLLAARLAGGEAIPVMIASGATWALGTTLLFLSDGLSQETVWWRLPALFGALALLGTPFTLGFVTEATLIEGLTRTESLVWGGAFFVGNLFMVPALARCLLLPTSPSLPNNRWLLLTRGIGLGIPALLLILVGLHPPLLISDAQFPTLKTLFTAPGLIGWLLWILSLSGSGVLAWQDKNLRPRMKLLLKAVYDLLNLNWFYTALEGALNRGLSTLRAADDLIGGAGALLWSWLLFLILLLTWGNK